MQHWSDEIDAGLEQERVLAGAFARAEGRAAIRPSYDLASDARAGAQARKRQTQRRLLWLQSLWDDPARFDAVVASGRYLKLCALLEWASENDETAAQRLGRLAVIMPPRRYAAAST